MSVDRRWRTVTVALLALIVVVVSLALVSHEAWGQASGRGVGAEVPVTPMDVGLALASNSPVLAEDPTDSRFLALAHRVDAPGFSCALQVSGDGGGTWSPAPALRSLPEGADTCYAPEVAFDGQGVMYYLFVGLAGPGNEPMGAFLTSSSDRGRTFSEPRQVLGPNNFSVRMAIDSAVGSSGRVHLVWLHATSEPPLGGFGPPPNPILSAHSDDGGMSFSEPVQVSDPARQRVVAPALVVDPGRGVHVAYYDLEDDAIDYQGLEGTTWPGTWTMVLASSSDGGRHFTHTVVDDAVVPHERVMLVFTMAPPAVVASEKHICAAWTDARHGDADVVLRCSTDEGQTWDELRRLNDDPVDNGLRQYLPRLALSPDGRIDAIFYDRRNDHANVLTDVFFTSSTDGGRHFTRNLRLTSSAFDSQIGQQYLVPSAKGQYEFGSRLGLLSGAAGVVAAWTDTRNSLSQTAGQEIFSTRVEMTDARPFGRWLPVIGIVVVTVGLAAGTSVIAGRRRRRAGDGTRPSAAGEEPSSERARVIKGNRSKMVPPGVAVGAVVLGALFVVSRGSASSEAPLPPGPAVVEVTMREHAFDYTPVVPGGRVVFRFHNAGVVDHDVDLVPLDESVPPIDVQLRGETRRAVTPFARLPPVAAGTSASFAVDLVEGQRYAMICSLLTDDGQAHALQGMSSEFRAGGGPPGPQAES